VLISLLFYPNWYYRRSQFEQFVVNSSNMATTEIEMSSLSIIVDDLLYLFRRNYKADGRTKEAWKIFGHFQSFTHTTSRA
jgi:hypothetical protein